MASPRQLACKVQRSWNASTNEAGNGDADADGDGVVEAGAGQLGSALVGSDYGYSYGYGMCVCDMLRSRIVARGGVPVRSGK